MLQTSSPAPGEYQRPRPTPVFACSDDGPKASQPHPPRSPCSRAISPILSSSADRHLYGWLLAAGGVPQDLAGICHSHWSELGDSASKRVTRQCVEVVESSYALGRYPVVLRRQLQLRHHPSSSPGQRGDYDRTDSVGDGVASEDQHRAVSARCGCKPDFTALHWPNPTSPLPDPNPRSWPGPFHRR